MLECCESFHFILNVQRIKLGNYTLRIVIHCQFLLPIAAKFYKMKVSSAWIKFLKFWGNWGGFGNS